VPPSAHDRPCKGQPRWPQSRDVSPEQPAVDVWLHVHGDAPAGTCERVGEALTAAGAAHHPLDIGAPRGAGVLCFDAFSSDLCELVDLTSCHGAERVVAVAFSEVAVRDAWRLLAAGAADVLKWDGSSAGGRELVARFQRWREVEQLVRSPLVREHLVGESPAWQAVLREVVELGRFARAMPILITGETGTGKELVARLIHALSGATGKLVILDCTTVQPSLAGSEFFGHVRGSFTGAMASREGAFALADGGTLFLDEVGELPASLQTELLRVVQEGTYKRIGTDSYSKTRFRLICASNRDLSLDEPGFRRDFYYRIAGWTCRLPALRERTLDIPLLAEHFLRELSAEGRVPPELTPGVIDFLVRREYPGNVRELRHLVARIHFRHDGEGPITLGAVPDEERPSGDLRLVDWRHGIFESAIGQALAHGAGLKEITTAASEMAVEMAVADASDDLQRAARRLRVTPRALQLRAAARRRAAVRVSGVPERSRQ
jgi:transcriptional regulator with GAF, ATPase, and Fis domain